MLRLTDFWSVLWAITQQEHLMPFLLMFKISEAREVPSLQVFIWLVELREGMGHPIL